MADAADFIGRGITFPLRVDQSGSIALGAGRRRHRRQHPHGAHHRARRAGDAAAVRLPHLGPAVRADQRQHARPDGARPSATRSSQWEPRVDSRTSTSSPIPATPAGCMIHLDYRVRATNDRRNLVFPFYVIPRGGPKPMSLPVPNLDDRTFQDLVDEAKRLIPHVLPGVDQPQPDRPRRGADRAVRLDDRDVAVPAQPGAGHVLHAHAEHARASSRSRRRRRGPTSRSGSSTSSTSRSSSRPAPQVSTAGERRRAARVHDARRPVDHPAAADGRARVARARRLRRRVGRPAPRQPGASSASRAPRRRPATASTSASSDSLAGNAIRIDDRRQRRGHRRHPDQAAAALGGVAGRGLDPRPRVYRDTTGGLNRDGQITLLVPPAHEPLTLGGQRAYWLRARRARARAGPADVPRVAADPPDPRRLASAAR